MLLKSPSPFLPSSSVFSCFSKVFGKSVILKEKSIFFEEGEAIIDFVFICP